MLIFISSFIVTVVCWPTFSSLSSVDNRKEERERNSCFCEWNTINHRNYDCFIIICWYILWSVVWLCRVQGRPKWNWTERSDDRYREYLSIWRIQNSITMSTMTLLERILETRLNITCPIQFMLLTLTLTRTDPPLLSTLRLNFWRVKTRQFIACQFCCLTSLLYSNALRTFSLRPKFGDPQSAH